MNKKNSYSCTLLKLERLKQNKGQKEVCHGICVPSYLSKIERNQVTPDSNILKQLFQKLGINFYCDDSFLNHYKNLIDQYYYQFSYGLERSAYEELQLADNKLIYSPLAIDWFIIQVHEGNSEPLKQLSLCIDNMSDQQRAYYYLAIPLEKGKKQDTINIYLQAFYILNNSTSLLSLMEAHLAMSQYDKVHEYADKCISLALEEGNTWNLAMCYALIGNVYAIMNIEDLMIPPYQRAIHLLQNTYWKEKVSGIYYNIGATYLQSRKYELALKHLNMVTWDNDFLLFHKKALAFIRMNKLDEAKQFIELMKSWISNNEDVEKSIEIEKMMLEEALYECEENYLDNPDFISLMEKLLIRLRNERHEGYVLFYKDILRQAYCRQRKYKMALELYI